MYKTKTYSTRNSITMADFFANSFLRTGYMLLISGCMGILGRYLSNKIIYNSIIFIGILIGGLLTTMIINFFIHRALNHGNISTLGSLCYGNVIIFGFITGITTAIYHAELIAKASFITVLVFFITATYGYFTKKDMSSLGLVIKILFMVIILLSLVGVVTSFFNPAWASWLFSVESFISIIFNIIFIVYFMDINKKLYNSHKNNHHTLQLYNVYSSYVIFTRILDLFLNILYLLGKEKKK